MIQANTETESGGTGGLGTVAPPSQDERSSPNRGDRAASAHLLGAALVSRGIRVLRGFVLARLLAPEVFGAYALIGALIGPLSSAANLGLAPLVARERDIDRRLLATAEWLGRVGSAAIFGVLAVAVGLWAEISRRGALLGPGVAVAAATALYLLPQVNIGLLQYRRKFSDMARLDLLFDAVWACVAIGLAVATRSVWALAGAELAAQVSRVLYSRRAAPSHERARRHAGYLGQILRFSSASTAGTFVWAAVFAAPAWILHRRLPDADIGQFSIAYIYSQIAATTLGGVVSRVSLPAIAAAPSHDRLGVAWKYAEALSLVLAPVTGLLACIGGPLLLVVIGGKWEAATGPFAILVWGMAARVVFPFPAVAQVGGRPSLEAYFGVLALAVFGATEMFWGWTSVVRAAAVVTVTDVGVSVGAVLLATLLWGPVRRAWRLTAVVWAAAGCGAMLAGQMSASDVVTGAARAVAFAAIFALFALAVPSLRGRYVSEVRALGRVIMTRSVHRES